jgi:hypothetical protein
VRADLRCSITISTPKHADIDRQDAIGTPAPLQDIS